MENKPFSIQSPENIAMQYGGDKQKIAQAMQVGIVDPTAGILAGMFIDRMRSAAQVEQAPHASVAQQVMAPPPPPQAAGLAAAAHPMPQAPQGAPVPPAGLAAAPHPMPQAPAAPRFADGGVASLPIPNSMFDEPTNGGFNDGYAGGGIVAFADGGDTGPGTPSIVDPVVAQMIQQIWNNENGGLGNFNKSGKPLTSPKGALFGMQVMPSTAANPGFGVMPARNKTPEEYNRVGRDLAQAMYKKYGNVADAMGAYNWGTGNFDKWVLAGRPANTLPQETQNYMAKAPANAPVGGATTAAQYASSAATPIINTMLQGAQGLAGIAPKIAPNLPVDPTQIAKGLGPSGLSFADARNAIISNTPISQDWQNKMMAEYSRQLSPEYQKQQKQQALWSTLADVGATLANTPGGFMRGLAAALGKGGQEAAQSRKDLQTQQLAVMQNAMALENARNAQQMGISDAASKAYEANARLAMGLNDPEYRLAAERAQIQANLAAAGAGHAVQGATTLAGTQAHEDAETRRAQTQTDALAQKNQATLMQARARAQAIAAKATPPLMGKPMTADELIKWRNAYAEQLTQHIVNGGSETDLPTPNGVGPLTAGTAPTPSGDTASWGQVQVH